MADESALSSRLLGGLITPNGRGLRIRAYALLFALCLAFFIPGLTSLPPIDRDEPLFAQASKQMIESGNYTDIRFQDAARYKKPIGIYWVQTLSVRALNPDHLNEIWAYRVPSLMGATLAVLMTAAFGCLLFTPSIGFLAALMMVGCVMLNSEARIAKTDAVLLATIVAAQYALARAYLGQSLKKSLGWGVPILFWTALAAGFLIKGPIILLVLAGTLLWLWGGDKNLSWFRALRPHLGIPYALLLVVPWFAAIIIASHGQFLHQSAGHDMAAKLWQGQDRGMVPPGMHALAFVAMFFPFSLLGLMAAPDAWHDRRDKAVRFCLGWIIPAWLVFELSMTKLPHYVMPMYPAIALLAARSLLEGFPTLATTRRRWPLALAIGLWMMVGTGLAIAGIVLPRLIDQEWDGPQIAASVILILAQATAFGLLMRRKPIGGVVTLLFGSLVFLPTMLGHTLPNLQHLWISADIMRVAEAVKPCSTVKITTATYREPSLVFLAGTDTRFYLDGAAANAELQRDPCRIAVIDDNRLRPFLENNPYATQNPHPVASLRAYNLGHGNWRTLNFYTLSPETPKP